MAADRAISLSGMKFGKLTVIERTKNVSGGNAAWVCRCECGNTITVVGTDLRNGERISCGCHRRIDLVGQKFGRLTVIGPSERYGHVTCRCECGAEIVTRSRAVTSGNTRSCGCWNRDVKVERLKTHGLHHSPEYAVWAAMLQRCNNPKSKSYKDYGGRGIKVCERWQSFENFYADMGPRPDGRSIDRINNDGSYEPENCRWATRVEQQNNRSANIVVTYGGQEMTIAQVSRASGVNFNRVYYEYGRGIGIFSEKGKQNEE